MTDFLFSLAEPVQGSVIDVLQIGSYDSTRYGKFEITREDFDSYIREFKDANASGRRQVDFDHKGSQGDTRAAGWIQDLHVDGDKLKATVEWTPAGEAAIKGKEYRFTSAEYQTAVRNKTTGKTESKKVLKAVTLTNRPFIDTMDPVALSDDPGARLAVLEDSDPDLGIELSTGTIGGTKNSKLPKSSYAWVDSSGMGHLPYKDSSGKVDPVHTRNALARLNQVKGMPDNVRTSVKGKLQAALRSAGGDPSDDNNSGRKNMSEIHTLLGLSEDAEDAQLLSAVQKLVEQAKEPAEGTVSLADFQAAVQKAEDTSNKFAAFERDTYLSEQVRAGRLAPAELTEGSIIVLYDAAPAAARKMIEARPVNKMLDEIGKTEETATGEKKLSEESIYANDGRKDLHERTLRLSEEKKISYGDAMILAAKEAVA